MRPSVQVWAIQGADRPDEPARAAPLALAVSKLRAAALGAADGAFLGSEDELVAALRVSRTTLKQAARLVEREGLVRVKRGVNGGYYGARPTERTIQSVVDAYLATIDVPLQDVVSVASVLWFEIVRRACSVRSRSLRDGLAELVDRIDALPPDISFHAADEIEAESRSLILSEIDSHYLGLMMRINQTFGHRQQMSPARRDRLPDHRDFISAWRNAKTLELSAIAAGDEELAFVAAQKCRTIWSARIGAGASSANS